MPITAVVHNIVSKIVNTETPSQNVRMRRRMALSRDD